MTTVLHPIIIGTPSDAGLPLQVGALVTYHGRAVGERWSIFFVADIDDFGLHTIVDRDYPSVSELHRVSRQHLTPTGTVVDLCDCGHETGTRDPGGVYSRWCAGMCGCDLHDHERTEEMTR